MARILFCAQKIEVSVTFGTSIKDAGQVPRKIVGLTIFVNLVDEKRPCRTNFIHQL